MTDKLESAVRKAAANVAANEARVAGRSGGPAPRDMYVFDVPIDAAVEWIVVSLQPQGRVLLVPADCFPFAGTHDVPLTSPAFERLMTARCRHAVLAFATVCRPGARTDVLPEEQLKTICSALADMVAAGCLGGEPFPPTPVDNDPEYQEFMEELRRAAETLVATSVYETKSVADPRRN